MQLRWGPRRRSPRLIALGGGGGGPDLISALPDDLLLLVLARLACAAAAARTDVLSRRWRGLWARLRQVVFTDVAPRSIEEVLARFPPAASLVQIRLHKQQQQQRRRVAVIPDTAGVNSLLRAAARLDPEELFFAVPSDPIQ